MLETQQSFARFGSHASFSRPRFCSSLLVTCFHLQFSFIGALSRLASVPFPLGLHLTPRLFSTPRSTLEPPPTSATDLRPPESIRQSARKATLREHQDTPADLFFARIVFYLLLLPALPATRPRFLSSWPPTLSCSPPRLVVLPLTGTSHVFPSTRSNKTGSISPSFFAKSD